MKNILHKKIGIPIWNKNIVLPQETLKVAWKKASKKMIEH